MRDEEILKKALEKVGMAYSPEIGAFEYIFSHDFAKAFWGECKKWLYMVDGEGMDYVTKKPETWENWQDYKEADGWKFHLQRMVLEENPIKYLEQFLESEVSSK